MKQVPSDKYNVAWFKLAQYVARREKERALGVYRLLSHSISDQAYVRQLEGDILIAFNDEQAELKYLQAAQLYVQQQQLRHAVAMYEHVLLFQPHSVEYMRALIELYIKLHKQERVDYMLELLFDALANSSSVLQVAEHESLLAHAHAPSTKIKIYERYLFTLLSRQASQEHIQRTLKTTITILIEQSDAHQLQQFLMRLQAQSPDCHAAALDLLK